MMLRSVLRGNRSGGTGAKVVIPDPAVITGRDRRVKSSYAGGAGV